MRLRFRLCAAAVAVAAATACSDSTAPPQRPAAQLHVVRLRSSAAFADTAVTFWAKLGQTAEVRLFFAAPGGGHGAEFVRLKLEDQTLLARPDGTPFLPGDSVQITMRVADPTLLQVELLPSGLRFNPVAPAELELHYDLADDDLNGDGQVNGEDAQLESELGIWRQETPSDPFVQLGTLLTTNLKRARAQLLGFTRYALAY